jgi:protein transport protein SEC31
MGVIAGGLENGEVALWNAKALLDKKSDKEVLLFANKAHKGAVKGLGFNNVQTNLLASGSVDGEVP